MAAGRVKLVFDENFSERQVTFVKSESSLGEIMHTRPLGWSGTPDKVWIPRAINGGFVIVSGDRNDKTREYTVADLKALGARLILIGGFWDHMDRWNKAKWLVRSIEPIFNHAGTMTPGSASLVVNKFNKIRDL